MSEPGYIRCTVRCNALGNREYIGFEWVGGPVCFVTRDLIYDGEIDCDGEYITIGPYRLRIIEEDWPRNGYRCVRVDYRFWWLVVAWYRYGRLLDIAYRRTIITLAVWGLARFNQASIPHWRDVHILRKIAEWLKK